MAELALSSTLASGGLPPPPGVLASLEAERFYHDAMACLAAEGIPFLLGGAYALYHHTGIRRWTKDLDLFVAPEVCEPVLACLARAGYRSELTDRRWLGKAFSGAHLVDVIFSSGNQVATVDALWFEHASRDEVLGVEVPIIPAEEMIWSKAFVMERDRYDGADVAHVILRRGRTLDWERLLWRMRPHWEVLYAHLVLFEFVYPQDRDVVPRWVVEELEQQRRRVRRRARGTPRTCRGRVLSRDQYAVDVHDWGYAGPEGAVWPLPPGRTPGRR
jgi:hypothetical protein